jgi:hypothetical protein
VLRYVAIILLLACAAAYAQPPGPFVLLATGKLVQVKSLSPGSWYCEGGQLTTTGPPFCSQGTKRMFFWNMSNKYAGQDVLGSAAAYVGGENVTTVHGNFDEYFYGYMFGTFQWTVPEMEGIWEGTFTTRADQMRGNVVNIAVGYGRGGKLEGLKLEIYQVTPGSGLGSSFIAVVTKR